MILSCSIKKYDCTMVNLAKQTYSKEVRFYLMGIAMVLVVMFHIAQHQETVNVVSKSLYYVFANGWVGVDMFFLLSAYGLCHSYNRNNLKTFYRNRFIRIMPAYPLTLIIGYVVAGTPFIHACYFFVQQITGVAIFNRTEDVLWYMEALILLYLFFPVLFRLCKMMRPIGIGFIILLCIIVHVLMIFIPDYWLQISVQRVPMMVVGVFTYLYEKDGNKRGLILIYGSLALMAIMPMVYNMYLFVPAILFLVARSECRVFNKTLTFIGKHSFDIFIGHHFALWIFKYSQWNYYLTLFMALVLISIFSSVICYLQKSFQQLTDHCFHRKCIDEGLNT